MNKIRLSVALLGLVLVSVFFSGCSEDKTETSDNYPAEYEGNWSNGCSSGAIKSYSIAYGFNSGVITVNAKVYLNDTECANLDQLDVVTYNMDFGDEITTLNALKADKVDVNIVTYTVTPKSANGVSNLNSDNNNTGYCGHTDWTIGVSKTISGNCTGTAASDISDVNTIFYTIMTVLDSSGELYFGEATSTLDESTADKRPNTLRSTGIAKVQ